MKYQLESIEHNMKFDDLDVGELFIFEDDSPRVYMKGSYLGSKGSRLFFAINIQDGKFLAAAGNSYRAEKTPDDDFITTGSNWINQQNVIPMKQKNNLRLEKA